MKLKIQRRHLITACTIIVIGLSTALLIGNRFDAKFAGGDGYIAHETVEVCTHTYDCIELARGNIVSTHPDSATFPEDELGMLYINMGATSGIFVGERTEVHLLDLRPDSVTFNVLQGNVRAIGDPKTITIRETTITTDYETDITHYSWMDEVQVAAISGNVTIETPEETHTVTSGATFSTLPPYTTEFYEHTIIDDPFSTFYD